MAIAGAGLLILAFPDFDQWYLAWFALVPLMYAVEREKASAPASFLTGWLFGTLFFFGSCWWLTYAPIHYAGFPVWLAYFLLLCVCLLVGLFPALFAGILSLLVRRFGDRAYLAAPFLWVFTEFLRYWITGNDWNAVGYSQAFGLFVSQYASICGVLGVSFVCLLVHAVFLRFLLKRNLRSAIEFGTCAAVLSGTLLLLLIFWQPAQPNSGGDYLAADVIAVQPNVPMTGLDTRQSDELRSRQADLAALAVERRRAPIMTGTMPVAGPYTNAAQQQLVVLPESPMNFTYTDDREFRRFIGDFARNNNVSVLFNSAEPEPQGTQYYNSAVLVGPDGLKAAQYNKIHLLPFGETVPPPFEGILSGFVGNYAYGREYDLIPIGDAKAGIMICFESHFGSLSRQFVLNGADVLIEMTNDGYLGPTPVLRQHLANAVFRAVETNRPVIRVTNVGITAYINERGRVLDEAPTYQEATRVWSVSKSDGSQTFYVKYGDWFAWLCTAVTLAMLVMCFRRKSAKPVEAVRS